MSRMLRSTVLCWVLAAYGGLAGALTPSPAAGNWTFEFDGDDTGRGRAQVEASGRIVGEGQSDALGVTLQVTGHVDAGGAMQFDASPGGDASTGAHFSGRVRGDAASGTWSNAALGARGQWRATRGGDAAAPLAKDGVDCTINGERSRGTLERADFSVDPGGTSGLFRLISLHPVPTMRSDQGPMLQLKASGVRGPGDYPLSVQPTWLSIVSHDGRDSQVTAGKFSFSRLDWRGSPVAAGTVKFSAGAFSGECRFALPMTVLDVGAMRQRAGAPAR